MKYFSRLDEGDKSLYSDRYFSGNYDHNIYIARANDDDSHRPKFYIRVNTIINNEEVKQGYLYFYLDFENKTSDFIGIKVDEKYRDLNIGSLLVSIWIDLCLNNGIDFLGTHKKQRKPFLIYLLKTYGFEIFDKSLYSTSKDLISICKREEDKSKILLFKDPKNEERFINSKLFETDNYELVSSFDGVSHLDDIIMPLQSYRNKGISYELRDHEKANVKVKRILKNHQK